MYSIEVRSISIKKITINTINNMPPTKNTSKNVTKNVTKSAPKTAHKTAPKGAKKAKTTETPPVEPVQPVEPVEPVQPVEDPLVLTSDPEVNATPYLEEFTSLVGELDTALNAIREIKSRLQKLEKVIHRDHKVTSKKLNGKRARKPRDPNAPKSGFAKPGPVSPEMRKFLGMKSADDLISRTDVTKRIHEYCKNKDLQNPADKRQIKADAPLRKLLKMSKEDELTFFNLQKFMKVHFPNKEGVYPTA